MYNTSSCFDKSVSKDLHYINLLGKYFHTNRVLRAAFGKEGHKLFLWNYKLCRQMQWIGIADFSVRVTNSM
jgi:hypothetical protein